MRLLLGCVIALAMMFGVSMTTKVHAADPKILKFSYYYPEMKMDDLFKPLVPYEDMEPEYQALTDYYKGLWLKGDDYNGVGIKVTRMAMDPVSNMRESTIFIEFRGRRNECGIVKLDIRMSGSYYKYQGVC